MIRINLTFGAVFIVAAIVAAYVCRNILETNARREVLAEASRFHFMPPPRTSFTFASADVAPSADWAAEIIDAIYKARVMILIFSASLNNSPQVRREVERALHRQVSILPFQIADVLPSKSLEYFLGSQHWMDAFPPPRAPRYARLCDHLKTRLATTAIRPLAAASNHAGTCKVGAGYGNRKARFHPKLPKYQAERANEWRYRLAGR